MLRMQGKNHDFPAICEFGAPALKEFTLIVGACQAEPGASVVGCPQNSKCRVGTHPIEVRKPRFEKWAVLPYSFPIANKYGGRSSEL